MAMNLMPVIATAAVEKSGLVQFDWTMVFQIVNTLILFFFLRKLLFKPVTEFMEKREQEIAGEYDQAAKLQQEADHKKAEYIEKLAKSDEEGKQIIREATAKAETRATDIVKQAEKDAADLKVKAQHDIEREQVKAINHLKDDIASMAMLAASKIIEKDVKDTDHRDMISKVIDEVGDTKWQS